MYIYSLYLYNVKFLFLYVRYISKNKYCVFLKFQFKSISLKYKEIYKMINQQVRGH